MYYLLLFFILYIFFCVFISQKYRDNNVFLRILNFLYAIFLIFLIGFRYNVGTDYLNYEEWFYFWYQTITIEWIYTGLNYLVRINGGEFFHFTLILAVISQVLLHIGFKKWKLSDKEISIALIIYTCAYIFNFANGVRQGLAILVCFIAVKYLCERKFWKYLFLILLGAGFHQSIIIMLPFYYIINKFKINYSTTIILILGAYLVVWSDLAIGLMEFLLKYSFYNEKYSESELIYNSTSGIFSLGVLIKVLLMVFLLFFIRNKEMEYNAVFNFYIIGTVIKILSLSTFLFNRVGMYFQFFEILVALFVLREIPNKKIRIIFLIIIVFVNVALLFKILILDAEANDFVYRSIFSK